MESDRRLRPSTASDRNFATLRPSWEMREVPRAVVTHTVIGTFRCVFLGVPNQVISTAPSRCLPAPESENQQVLVRSHHDSHHAEHIGE